MEETTQKHESQAQVSFSRVTCSGPVAFYGSDVKVNNWIALKISTSSKRRNSSNDWYLAEDEIIEVRLSPNQFSELLTTMNVGEGVPATIVYHNGDLLPQGRIQPPIEENKTEIFKREIDEHASTIQDRMRRLESTVENCNITVKAKKQIIDEVKMLRQEINSNFPFILLQAKEQVDKLVSAGKSAVDAFYTGVITRLGVAALKSAPQIALVECKSDIDKREKNDE
jgi:hypothetical protein